MKTLIYKKVNKNFTLKNLSLYLTKFWFKEVCSARKKDYSKVWLTIIVDTKHNRSYTLIKNLPFNTKDYGDVITVLKQNVYAWNKDYHIKSIIFKYNLISCINKGKDPKYVKDNKAISYLFSLTVKKGMFVCKQILSLLSILIIILGLYLFVLTILLWLSLYIGNVYNLSFTSFDGLAFLQSTGQEVGVENIICCDETNTNKSIDFTNNKWSIFDVFIKLFNSDMHISSTYINGKCSASSMFIANNAFHPASSSLQVSFGSDTVSNSFCLGEYIIYHEFYKVFILQDYLEALTLFSLPL